MQVSTWLSNTAFHFRPIWLQNLIAIDSESYQRSFQSSKLLCTAKGNGCAVWLESEQTLLYWTAWQRQFGVDLNLLLSSCTQHADLFLCLILTWNQWVIARLIEAMSAALVCNKFSRNPLIFHFQREKVCCHCTKCVKQLIFLTVFDSRWYTRFKSIS